jgi:UDP-2,3-diacylglucosamine pyrophosphatase LpxH
MIIAVSDVHVGHSCCEVDSFVKFLDEKVDNDAVRHFVLIGDIFDMWRRDSLTLFLEYEDILEKLKALHTGTRKVHYVVGNHDYRMIKLKKTVQKRYSFTVRPWLKLQYGNTYYFIHGYQFEYSAVLDTYERFADRLCMSDDSTGASGSKLWDLYKMEFSFLERFKTRTKVDLRKALLSPRIRLSKEYAEILKGNARDELREKSRNGGNAFMVYGHTHRPFENEQNLTNTGSWVKELDRDAPWNTYVTIRKGGTPVLEEYSKLE